jgi:hypothetical protein
MRTFKDGKIKPDCFSEKRLLGFPPGVGVLLIMFNRYHNYIVENLAVYVYLIYITPYLVSSISLTCTKIF